MTLNALPQFLPLVSEGGGKEGAFVSDPTLPLPFKKERGGNLEQGIVRILCALLLGFSSSLFPSFAFPSPSEVLSDKQLAVQIQEAKNFYDVKYREVEARVNEHFQIDYSKLMRKHEARLKVLNTQTALIHQIQNLAERAERLGELKREYQDEEMLLASEAHHYFHNEMDSDHLFVGEFLSRLERLLDGVIEKEPLFRYVFQSPEFRRTNGLVMKRVVWQAGQVPGAAAETTPLNVHSVFMDKSKTPFLIKITPYAFANLSYLRSVLLHELNHIYLFKDPDFADSRQFAGGATQLPTGPFTHYFKQMNPYQQSYQYHLIHEYYSFRSQMLFDEIVPDNPYYRLQGESKSYLMKMLAWSYSQLNAQNKAFVKRYQDPPIMKLIKRFYA